MFQSHLAAALVAGVTLPMGLTSGAPCPQPPDVRTVDSGAERRAVEAALGLVPSSPRYQVVIIDPDLAAEPAAVRRLDAFTVRDTDGRLRPKVKTSRSPASCTWFSGRALLVS
jgi:hypothetical protein